jgi:hypothetical protein
MLALAYKDKVSETINDETFATLSESYKKEHNELRG